MALLAACGGPVPGDLAPFLSGRTVSAQAAADVEIVAPVPVRVASVRVVPGTVSVSRGGVAVFGASAFDRDGRLITDVTFSWRMRDPRAGTMSTAGILRGGEIPGTYDNAVTAAAIQRAGDREFTAEGSASVVVTTGLFDTGLGSVAVFPSEVRVRPGEVAPLRAAALGSNGGLVQDVAFVWRVTDARAGQIDQNGLLTAGSTPGAYPGGVEVQARRLGGTERPVTARALVRVLSESELLAQVRAVIGPAAVIGEPGDSVTLVFLSFDFQGRPVPVRDIRWEVAEAGAGSVTPTGRLTVGSVVGQHPGAVRANATLGAAYEGQTITASADVVVRQRAVPVGGLPGDAQMIPEALRLSQGQRARLSVVYVDERGELHTAERAAWAARTASVIVDERGYVTAVGAPGILPDAVSVQVPAGPGGALREVRATVIILGELSRVEVFPSRAVVERGDLVQFSAQAYDAANNRLFDVSFSWALAEGVPGTLTRSGLYAAGDRAGTYPGGARVTAVQRLPR